MMWCGLCGDERACECARPSELFDVVHASRSRMRSGHVRDVKRALLEARDARRAAAEDEVQS